MVVDDKVGDLGDGALGDGAPKVILTEWNHWFLHVGYIDGQTFFEVATTRSFVLVTNKCESMIEFEHEYSVVMASEYGDY
jgi:hypothetical protein